MSKSKRDVTFTNKIKHIFTLSFGYYETVKIKEKEFRVHKNVAKEFEEKMMSFETMANMLGYSAYINSYTLYNPNGTKNSFRMEFKVQKSDLKNYHIVCLDFAFDNSKTLKNFFVSESGKKDYTVTTLCDYFHKKEDLQILDEAIKLLR